MECSYASVTLISSSKFLPSQNDLLVAIKELNIH